MHVGGGSGRGWRVVNVHGAVAKSVGGGGMGHWEGEGMPVDAERGRLLLEACSIEEDWLVETAARILSDLRKHSDSGEGSRRGR